MGRRRRKEEMTIADTIRQSDTRTMASIIASMIFHYMNTADKLPAEIQLEIMDTIIRNTMIILNSEDTIKEEADAEWERVKTLSPEGRKKYIIQAIKARKEKKEG
jgi:hypothetical protein